MSFRDTEVETRKISLSYKRFSTKLQRWLKQRQPSEEVILFGTSLVVGLGAGVGAIAFRYLIKAVEWIGYIWFPSITSKWGKNGSPN